MKPTSSIGAVVISAAAFLFASSASALTFVDPNPGCATANVQYATACMGIYDGNNSNQDLDGLFGVSGWTETFKVDAPSGTDEVLTTTTNSDDTMGTWEFDFTGYKDVMFVLKGGNTFTAYLMDVDGPSMGAWRSDDLLTGGGKRGAGLSHFSAYTTPVPLPAAVWLFGAAILGMAGFSRRRKA